jgi:hypothetical protein
MSCSPSYGPSPPQDKAYTNFQVFDRLVAKNLVACNLNGKSLTVDDIVVNNSITAPGVTINSVGQYNPVVLALTGITIVSGPTADYVKTGDVVQVTGSAEILFTGGAATLTIDLPIPAAATSAGSPKGICTYIQNPPALNSSAGVVYPFFSVAQAAEIYFAAVGLPGVIVFTFSYIAA